MAKVEKVKARKDYPQFGIKKGDEHYTWQLFKRPKMRSILEPTRSQLTGSSFFQSVYDFADVSVHECQEPDDFKALTSTLEDLKSEVESSKENMPEGLQEGSTGQQLEARAEGLQEWIDAIETAASTYEDACAEIDDDEELDDDEKASKKDEARTECLDEITGAEPSWE